MKQPKDQNLFQLGEESRPRLSTDPIGLKEDVFPEDDFEISFLEGVLEQNPFHEQALIYLGHAYTARGDYEKGLEIDKRLVRLRPDDPTAFYNLACSYSLLNRIDEAVEAFRKAVEKGFDNMDHILRDPDLENLRHDPRFAAFIKKLG